MTPTTTEEAVADDRGARRPVRRTVGLALLIVAAIGIGAFVAFFSVDAGNKKALASIAVAVAALVMALWLLARRGPLDT